MDNPAPLNENFINFLIRPTPEIAARQAAVDEVNRFLGLPVANNRGIAVEELPLVSNSSPSLEFDVKGLLTRLFIQTKIRQWGILSDSEMNDICLATRKYHNPDTPIERMFKSVPYLVLKRVYGKSNRAVMTSSWQDIQKTARNSLVEDYPHVTEMLIRFEGRIIAAGGAIFRRVNSLPSKASDIDLFFVDPEVESSNIPDDTKIKRSAQLLHDAVAYLTEKWMSDPYNEYDDHVRNQKYVLVTRNEFVTTVNLVWFNQKYAKIQFIHRVYPTVGSILGGFDLTSCMIGFDGHRFLAIEIGAWSALGGLLIVDNSRRSTSFEHRLQKYGQSCHLVFPGLSKHVKPSHINNWISLPKASELVSKIIGESGFLVATRKNHAKLIAIETPEIMERRRDLIQNIHEIVGNAGFRLDDFSADKLVFTDRGEDEKEELLNDLRVQLFAVGYLFSMNEYLNGKAYSKEESGFRVLDINLKLPYADLKVKETNNESYGCRRWNLRIPKDPRITYTPAQPSDYADWTIRTSIDIRPQKASDYDDTPLDASFAVLTNTSLLIRGCLAGVTSVSIIVRKGVDLKTIVYDEFDQEKTAYVGLKDCVVELDFNAKDSIVRSRIGDCISKIFDTVNLGNVLGIIQVYKDRIRQYSHPRNAREFLFPMGVFGGDAITNNQWDELESKVLAGMIDVGRKLITPTWILRNPGRQWTSSINPIMADPRDWYGRYYTQFRVGNVEVETCLRLFRRRTGNWFAIMPRDLFTYLMGFIMWAGSYSKENILQNVPSLRSQ